MNRTKARLLPFVCAFAIIATAGIQVYARPHPIVTTGCVQAGTAPNTYVLYTDSPGKYRVHAGNPSRIARAEINPIQISPENKADLQRYVGHRIRVKGTLIYEGPGVTKTASAGTTTPLPPGMYKLRATSIHRIAGT